MHVRCTQNVITEEMYDVFVANDSDFSDLCKECGLQRDSDVLPVAECALSDLDVNDDVPAPTG